MANELVRRQNMQKVLHQAMKLFTANGVENTFVEMIARASDLSLRSVQNYYKTKKDLIAAVLDNGYANELAEMSSLFTSEQYLGKTGAEQIMEIITITYDKAIEHADIVFCTTQMQHMFSRLSRDDENTKLGGNWQYLMENIQRAFDRGHLDGSIAQRTEDEIVDVKAIILVLRGIQEQVAFALCDKTLRELLAPEEAIKKYVRQMQLLLTAK